MIAIALVALTGGLLLGRRPSATPTPAATASGPASAASAPVGCDARLSFTPEPPRAGSSLRVVYAHGAPLKYVDLKVTGTVYPGVRLEDLALEDRATWSWEVTALAPGDYRFEVWGGKPSAKLVVCDRSAAAE